MSVVETGDGEFAVVAEINSDNDIFPMYSYFKICYNA